MWSAGLDSQESLDVKLLALIPGWGDLVQGFHERKQRGLGTGLNERGAMGGLQKKKGRKRGHLDRKRTLRTKNVDQDIT